MKTYADVVFKAPLNAVFTYSFHRDPSSKAVPLRFKRVLVPFGGKKEAVGFVVLESEKPSYQLGELKGVIRVLDERPLIGEADLELAKWIAHYYQSSLGEAIALLVPMSKSSLPKAKPSKPRNKKTLPTSEVGLRPFGLNEEQAKVAEAVKKRFGQYKAFLLHGITGSGKTFVYLELIRYAMSKGRQVIFLVPEIGLTPQLKRTMASHFGEGTFAVLHGKVSSAERRRIHARSRKGELSVLIGPRSCLFAPTPNLGLVVVDEEHDSAYKNDASPRYHARGVAQQKCKLHNALLVLGSATPSLESYHRARSQSDVEYLAIRNRFFNLELPSIDCMSPEASSESKEASLLPDLLLKRMYKVLSANQQAILYLNHRGYSTAVFCAECNHWYRCKRCALSLSYHKKEGKLLCHQCGYSVRFGGGACVRCGRRSLRSHRAGTEKLVQEVERKLPMARVLRFDSDSLKTPKAIQEALRSILEQRYNVVVGTQMIIKGHDFPKVQLVVMVTPEDALRFPDYRASERAFSQIVQVSGRAGRRHDQGEVVLLTSQREHEAIRFGLAQACEGFYELELKSRKEFQYPPFAKMCRLVLRGRDDERVADAIKQLKDVLSAGLAGVDVLGPAPCLLSQVKHHYRWNVLLRIRDIQSFLKTFPKLREEAVRSLVPSGAYLEVDMDPVDLL